MEKLTSRTTPAKSVKKRKNDDDSGKRSENSTTTAPSTPKDYAKSLGVILKKIKLTDSSDKNKGRSKSKTKAELEKPKKRTAKKETEKKTTTKKEAPRKKSSSRFSRSRGRSKPKLDFDGPDEGSSFLRSSSASTKKEPAVAKEIKAEEADKTLPYWLTPQYLRDRSGKRPNEEGYDPTTMLIPKKEYENLPSVHKKYWKFKGRYFDKMVAVKMWSAYFFYGQDAITIHKLFDTKLNELSGRIYTQFHECMLPKYAPKLLENGHKIVVVEKVKKNQKKDDDRTKKGVHQVITRGTFTDNLDLGYSSQFCLCIFEHRLKFGLVYFDTTTHEFFLGEFQDDNYRANLRTLVTRLKPVEIVYLPKHLEKETLNMLRALPTQPTMSPLIFKESKVPSISDIDKRVMKYFGMKAGAKPLLPKILADIKERVKDKIKDKEEEKSDNDMEPEEDNSMTEASCPYYFTLQSLMLCVTYLESVLLAETVFSMGSFFALDIELEKRSTLYLDSQALENLEILEIGYLNNVTEDQSLFGYMDKTVSPFGKRMFRRWVISPLFDSVSINERLDAVEELIKRQEVVEYYHDKLRSFPDLERITNRIYNLTGKKKMFTTHFDDLAKNRLGDFINLLTELEKVEPIIEKLSEDLANSKSKRLKQLTKIKELDMKAFEKRDSDYKVYTARREGMFPKISHLVTDLKSMMEPRSGLLLPAAGLSDECDSVIVEIDKLKERLQDVLDNQKRYFKCDTIKYVHTKHRYELEIPENVLEKVDKPREFVITSKKKGVVRMHTPEIERCLTLMDDYELKLNKGLLVFVVDYFRRFYERKAYWSQVILCLAELDCLCSLAKLAVQMTGSCRPIAYPADAESIFELKDMVHPCVAKRNPDYVSNDLVIQDEANILLLTGPNMGGKSTFLRQACIAVIMAQIGSFVPASYFRFSVVDRIFTRLGASDRLVEGKSTFFIEMEETHHMVTEATRNSLLVVDELGRGTSTYDGVSIAYAALKFIAHKIKCMTLFATHYHMLIEEFSLYKNVETFCMLCDFDAEKEELTFKYKFIRGEASSSHGLMIAKMAGLPKEILQVAKGKAAMMTKEKVTVKAGRELTKKFNNAVQVIEKVEKVKLNKVDSVLRELKSLL